MVEELVDVVVVDVRSVAEDLMAFEDAADGGGRGGAADRGGHGRGHVRGRVSNVDRQRLVDAFKNDDNYHELAALLGIPYQTAQSIICVWLAKVVYKDYQKAELVTSN